MGRFVVVAARLPSKASATEPSGASHSSRHGAAVPYIRCCVLILALVPLLTVFAGRASATPPRYSVTDLGGLGGNLTIPQGLNGVGHATGYGNKVVTAVYYGYFWDGAQLRQACSDTFSSSHDISSGDKMVGAIKITTRVKGQTLTTYHVGTCQGTTQTDLGRPTSCSSDADGVLINDSNTIVATCSDSAFVLKNGVYTNVPTFGGTQNIPNEMNSSGVVVGNARNAAGSSLPYIWDGTLHALPALPICAGQTPTGDASGINDLGDVVGIWCGEGFLDTNGQLTDLGAGKPSVINNNGLIAGTAGGHAAVYDWASGLWFDLNSLASPIPQGIVLTVATDINDNGQLLVVAVVPTPAGTPFSGLHEYSYLLTPLGPSSTAAPSSTSPSQISGLPISGDVLTATPGMWSGAPSSYAYQWQRCDTNGSNCTDIGGATSSTYTAQPADLGSTLRARVNATNEYGTASASSAATAVIQTALNAFSPQLWYDSQETYRADSAAEITDNCWIDDSGNVHNNVLQDVSGAPIASACPPSMFNYPGPLDQLGLNYLGPNYSTTGNQAATSDLIGEWHSQEGDFLRLHGLPQYANRIYGRVTTYPEGDSILQYWFWYYNQPNFAFLGQFGGHEGDWEGVQVHLDANGHPIDATYDQHGGGELCSWNQVSVSGTHPIAFVAHNSHATYFWSGFHHEDRADGGGELLTPTVGDISSYASTSWLFWPGHWGGSTGTEFPGAQPSPSGPGRKGPEWDDPRAWQASVSGCSIPSPVRTLVDHTNRSTAPAQVTVPAPRVAAHRVAGRRARVTYCFSPMPKSQASRPAFIEVSLQSADKHIPPYTVKYRADLPCGQVDQTIGSGPSPFQVLASAWTRRGYGSRVVRVPLR